MIATELALLGAPDLLAALLPAGAFETQELPPRLDANDSRRLVQFTQRHRLAPILADSVHRGAVVLTEDATAELNTTVQHYLASQLRVEQQGVVIIDALQKRSVDFRLLKGMATGFLDYPNPALRPVGDLDIFVDARNMPVAIEALSQLPGGRFHNTPRNDWRVTHALPFRLNGIEVDLHHRLLHQAAGHCASRLDVLADAALFEISGRSVQAMPPWLRLLQAASQNVLGGYPQATSDLDVARLSAHVPEAIDRADDIGLGWVIREGIRRSQHRLEWGTTIDAPQIDTWRDRGFRHLYGSRKASVLELSLFEIINARPSIALAIVRGALRPGDVYLERRGRSTQQQLGRQIDRLRGRRL